MQISNVIIYIKINKCTIFKIKFKIKILADTFLVIKRHPIYVYIIYNIKCEHPKGPITRPNFYMKLKRETVFHKLFSEHLVLHNLFSFEFSLQFMKLGLVV